jgi:hypothetical protein
VGESGEVVRPSAIFVEDCNVMGDVCDSSKDTVVVKGYEHVNSPRAGFPKRSHTPTTGAMHSSSAVQQIASQTPLLQCLSKEGSTAPSDSVHEMSLQLVN